MNEDRLLKYTVTTSSGHSDAEPSELHGDCDAVVIINAVTEDDATHAFTSSFNGKTGRPLKPFDIFNYWASLGDGLARNPAMPEPCRVIARTTAALWAKVLQAAEEDSAAQPADKTDTLPD